MSENEKLQLIRAFLESPLGSLVSGVLMVLTLLVGAVLVIGNLL